MENIAHQIVGTWRLIHSIQVNSDGKREYPYGEDAVGYIYYSNTGLMAVHISRKFRGDSEDLAGLKRDYLAYFGRYEIDIEKHVVRHFVEGQLFPGDRCEVLERAYRFDGDLMTLTPTDGTHREILWQRVGSDKREPEPPR